MTVERPVRQIERDGLNELIASAEAHHGPVGDDEIRARRDQLRRAREQQQVDASPATSAE
ncbi:hypothetical protein [Streptomyces sp. NPDC088725]|uniref:hypothetical protein n=1 Tax=Streptomyces sp. NPDC088725 TaxID=3365873 RepID=UPI003802C8BE